MILRAWYAVENWFIRIEKRFSILFSIFSTGLALYTISPVSSYIIFSLVAIVILSLLAESTSNQTRIFAVRFVSLVCLLLVSIFFIFNIFKHYSSSQTTQITLSNLLACLGNTGGEQRHMQLSGCLKGVSLPTTTTADQIIDILGTIPRDSTQWHDALVDLLKNNKITISGKDATRLLSVFGSEQKRSSLIGILCHIKRPIPDSDKNELLRGIDPMYVSYVRQQLEEPTNPPCEK